MRGSRICRAGIISALVLAVAAMAAPAFAQSGQVKGTVVDAQNKPVEKAKITFLAVDTNRKMETTTDRKGEFRQVGLSPGNYTITAEKDGLMQSFDVRVSLETKEVNFSLTPASGGDAAESEGLFPRGTRPLRVLQPLVAILAMTGVISGPGAEGVGQP